MMMSKKTIPEGWSFFSGNFLEIQVSEIDIEKTDYKLSLIIVLLYTKC